MAYIIIISIPSPNIKTGNQSKSIAINAKTNTTIASVKKVDLRYSLTLLLSKFTKTSQLPQFNFCVSINIGIIKNVPHICNKALASFEKPPLISHPKTDAAATDPNKI
ncbi:MAG: hypothetical protein K6F17_08095 [Lachnospiraceae bacterium]|nr:hypothetical protein [Lachnospiraceae bacterium]